MEETSIRLLTEDDAEIYWAIRLRALRENPEAFHSSYETARQTPLEDIRQRFRARYNSPENIILGGFLNGQLVGTVGLVREGGPKLRHKGIIWGVYVAPEARRRGLGKALMNEAIARARELPGLELLQLGVWAENTAARSLYLSLGFEVFGLERRALKIEDRYYDEEHMVLWLAGAEMKNTE
jgi:ribosomal protein S18 acetylase RimI-like enzyme